MMTRTAEQWSKVRAASVCAGSTVQAENVLGDALRDIASLHAIAAAARNLAHHVRRSVNVGPLSKSPAREAVLWRELRRALQAVDDAAVPGSEGTK